MYNGWGKIVVRLRLKLSTNSARPPALAAVALVLEMNGDTLVEVRHFAQTIAQTFVVPLGGFEYLAVGHKCQFGTCVVGVAYDL